VDGEDVVLQGKVAVVTGGGSGIGAAVARRFAAAGAHVAILDVNARAAQDVARACPDSLVRPTDVSNSGDVAAAFETIEASLGRVDVLANVAGVVDTESRDRHLSDLRVQQQRELAELGRVVTPLNAVTSLSDEEWQRSLAVNLTGAFYCMRAALPSMIAGGGGSIINTSSVTALTGYAGSPHYAAAKAGILGLTRSVAREVAMHGVRVNAVVPGAVDTPMNQRLPAELRRTGAIPVGRQGTADELAAVYLFLASPGSAYVVGESVIVDGGMMTM
jgi:3-oxoacyl-[acyl-carrier protein] reductase